MSKTSTTPVNTSNAKGKTLHISKPLGHTNIPALICGGVAALIVIALDLLNRFDSMVLSVQQAYQSKPFFLESVDTWHRSWDWVLAIILASTVAYVVLDSAGKGKRIFFGIASIILTGMFSPLLMLWGVFWFPVVVIGAVVFSFIFALIYSSLHIMPCELGVKMKLVKNKKPNQKKHQNESTPLKKSNLVKKLEESNSLPEVAEESFKPIEKS